MCEIIPNPGKIRIYTSGCPKNQNKCWYRIGSPPPAGSKNDVLKFRSVSSIVIAPASTGRDRSSRMAVISTDHTNSGVLSIEETDVRMFEIVVMKFTAPRIDDAPAKCNLKIPMSTLIAVWKALSASGGYTVHPVPIPFEVKEDIVSIVREGGSSQNLMLFIRGNAISGAPIIRGTSQFPNPPIIIGITMKKIITNA